MLAHLKRSSAELFTVSSKLMSIRNRFYAKLVDINNLNINRLFSRGTHIWRSRTENFWNI